ncbi:unnamed protein product [Lymnaea stagnalis]|uniref:guanylate cyclase n=1 Tax=Lymnaea stagnalis TaxID=6523 RepID=A0AAV2IKN7_LYMST
MLRDEDVAAHEYIEIATLFSPFAEELYRDFNRTNTEAFTNLQEYRLSWKVNNFPNASAEKGRKFHKSVMEYFNMLARINRELSKKVLDKVDAEITTSINMMVVACLVFICVLIMTPILVKLMHTLTMSIQNYAIEASHKSQQLIIEKQRSDSLLYQMLPKSVAQQLKMHKTVNAEFYDQVTLFFSDIVGFTKISAASTPLQVVVLLNQLYQIFDDILDHYDVYKVETIGDAYMVVSGLPNRNGSTHCAEISLMAIELLKTTIDFHIPHMPSRTVELRIGCHSGSAVAGVVGNKMPRYCLFGDTVNTASRMESHGMPNRIHISFTMNALLMKIKGFTTERRGIIDIKGKGQMETYWLLSTDRPLMTLASNGVALPDITRDSVVAKVKHHNSSFHRTASAGSSPTLAAWEDDDPTL